MTHKHSLFWDTLLIALVFACIPLLLIDYSPQPEPFIEAAPTERIEVRELPDLPLRKDGYRFYPYIVH